MCCLSLSYHRKHRFICKSFVLLFKLSVFSSLSGGIDWVVNYKTRFWHIISCIFDSCCYFCLVFDFFFFRMFTLEGEKTKVFSWFRYVFQKRFYIRSTCVRQFPVKSLRFLNVERPKINCNWKSARFTEDIIGKKNNKSKSRNWKVPRIWF